ncbi:MAG: PspC domain-containing protein [Prevotellaceae bacterium]|nr:PspC domain-containing protein [Prevotellaceae bacterium]
MKKVMNVGIGGVAFIIDEDAYYRLHNYLTRFKGGLDSPRESAEVMSDVEQRIAELFREGLRFKEEVVNLALVEKVITRLGFPEGTERTDEFTFDRGYDTYCRPRKRLHRDPDNKALGGVCSGIAAYFDMEILLWRIIFVVAIILPVPAVITYVILWIAVPSAHTAAQKLEMRGLPVTAENLRKAAQGIYN